MNKITAKDLLSPYISIIDADGTVLSKKYAIKSFNLDTKEAEVFKLKNGEKERYKIGFIGVYGLKTETIVFENANAVINYNGMVFKYCKSEAKNNEYISFETAIVGGEKFIIRDTHKSNIDYILNKYLKIEKEPIIKHEDGLVEEPNNFIYHYISNWLYKLHRGLSLNEMIDIVQNKMIDELILFTNQQSNNPHCRDLQNEIIEKVIQFAIEKQLNYTKATT